MAEEESNLGKAHRPKQSGPKAGKKKNKNEDKDKSNSKKHNVKAFTFQSVVKAAKQFRRSKDIETKEHHIPVVDRSPLEPPPIIVAVVGPPKVGKTTLINSLLKNFTRQNLSNIQGPVTLVSGKKRRITLLECGNDINSMIDVSKIADLVLILIDASFGFEMEVFEFLNICQVHGFPKIMGVLTHLDMLKNNKSLKKTKKKLKDRFWTEVYQGAKLFYLSGLIHGFYPKVEVHNLGRFISVMKFRPLTWRTSHPYILADRMEDLTDPESIRQNPKCDRKVSLYGYVRGAHLKYSTKVHLLGCGDYKLDDLSLLRDPCPLPDKEKKRTLNESERLVYAPMSGVGGIVYDKDAVYIDLGGSHSGKTICEQETRDVEDNSKPHNELVSSLIDTKHTLDSKMASSHMSLFKDGITVSTEEFSENDKQVSQQIVHSGDGRVRRKAHFEGSDNAADTDESSCEEDDNDEEGSISGGGGDDDDDSRSEGEYDDDDISDDEDLGDNNDRSKNGENYRTTKSLESHGWKEKAEKNAVDSSGSQDEYSEESFNQSRITSKDNTRELSKEKLNLVSKSKTKKKVKKSYTDSCDSEEEFMEALVRESNTQNKRKLVRGGSSEKVDSVLKKRKKKDASDEQLNEDSHYELKPKATDTFKRCKKIHDLQKRTNENLSNLETKQGVPNSDSEMSSDEEINFKDFEEASNSDPRSDDEMENNINNGCLSNSDSDFGSDDDEDIESDKESGQLKWKDNILQKASEAFYRHQQSTPNLRKLVYGNVVSETTSMNDMDSDKDSETIGGFFKVKSNKREIDDDMQKRDCSLEETRDLDLEDVMENIPDCFVTGKWNEDEDAEQLLGQDDQLSDEEIYGDFEDLETGETHSGKDASTVPDEEIEQSEEDEQKEKQDKMSRIEKKKTLKAAFNSQYDEGDEASFYEELKAQMSEQAQLNQREFEDMDDETRVQYEGFRPGMYVRVELKSMPCEFVTNFDARYPIILGGVLSNEDSLGYIQVRVKKHRWFKRILKTRDPLVLSIGWRRFQSLVMYSMQDHNGRHRLLKYTPEHLHCTATFYGPIAPPNTGVLAVQSVAGTTSDFRVSATGTVLALDKSLELVKKLKLTGTPSKVFKNTAFIKGMFNSALEVAKFEGASIRSVSGIRGQIKRALKAPEGAFRATFEDKLLISDIVFVRTWYPVAIPKFYNPVTSLLLPNEAKVAWEGMKTVGQLRKAAGIKVPVNQDSIYKPIERQTRRFNPLVIPDKLQKNLPFKSKPKDMKKRRKQTMEAKRAVVVEPHEKKVYNLMQQLYTANKEKVRKRKEKMQEKRKTHKAELAKIDAKRQQKRKDERKKVFKMMAQAEKKKKKN